jgi:hypothetical protein
VQCGWCGAINPQHHSTNPKTPQADLDAQHTATNHARTWDGWLDRIEERLASICSVPDAVCSAFSAVIVGWVYLLVAAIGVVGTYPILYTMCKTTLSFVVHLVIAAILLFSIFFNYTIAVWRSPGNVEDFYDTHQHPPERGAFNDFTFCYKCASLSLHQVDLSKFQINQLPNGHDSQGRA